MPAFLVLFLLVGLASLCLYDALYLVLFHGKAGIDLLLFFVWVPAASLDDIFTSFRPLLLRIFVSDFDVSRLGLKGLRRWPAASR